MSKRRDGDDPPPSPWLAGVGDVRGVRPPGRRLSWDEPRPNAWSASGVRGVTPPGRKKPDANRGRPWREQDAQKKRVARHTNEKKLEAARRDKPQPAADPMRPTAGYTPEIFAELHDPASLATFLASLQTFFVDHPPSAEATRDFASLVTQSRTPFDIVVAFTILNAAVGSRDTERARYAAALERGARTYYNLAQRLEPDLEVPSELAVHKVDALFFALPTTALQVPYAYATAAFLPQLALLYRREPDHDEQLVALARGLHHRFIEGRSLGDQPLSEWFPWAPPEIA